MGLMTLSGCLQQDETLNHPFYISTKVHPDVSEAECGTFQIEEDHPGLAALNEKGIIRVRQFSYSALRHFHKCQQTLKITFNKKSEYYQYLTNLHGCVPYPFYGSGADYHFMMSAMEQAASSGDIKAYSILMAKDSEGCASELNQDLFDVLLENQFAFIRAFKELEFKKRQRTVANYFSYSLNLEKQLFSNSQINLLPKNLRTAAEDYNKMLADMHTAWQKRVKKE